MKKYQELREKYPRFFYLSSEVEPTTNAVKLKWHFRLEGKNESDNLDFYPTLAIPLPTPSESTLTSGSSFPTKTSAPDDSNQPPDQTSYLIPLGGGKDSIVTLELVKQIQNLKSKIYHPISAFAINPTDAVKQTAKTANVPLISVRRQLDPLMLKLNNQGFLNGHTPFSALIAFTSILVAKLYQLDNIALSNESSANEPTLFWQDQPINHQYSKSYQFETDLREYVEKLESQTAIVNKTQLGLTREQKGLAVTQGEIELLAFQLGLVEMLSYWKLTASPTIVIEAGSLNQDQLKFWQKLLTHGLGEYFYVNQIPFWEDGLVRWVVNNQKTAQRAVLGSANSSHRPNLSLANNLSQLEKKSSVKGVWTAGELNPSDQNDKFSREPSAAHVDHVITNLTRKPNYFSFLRPLHELQIASLFAQVGQDYFAIFRSCNVGQKQGIWCNACPKCLFAYTMIFPFVGEAQALKIWGENLFDKESLLQTAYQLVGAKIDDKQNVKPFECVGTKLESLVAFWLATQWYCQRQRPLPYILKQFDQHILPQYQNLDRKALEIFSSFDKNNYLPKELEVFLKRKVKNHALKLSELAKGRDKISHHARERERDLKSVFQNYLLVGLGREGLSSFNFLIKRGIKPTNISLVDDKPADKLSTKWQEAIKQYSLKITTSDEIVNSKLKIQNLKLVKSPGIPHSHPLIKWAQQHHIPITSNTQMFFEVMKRLDNGEPLTIGITGTKGKSTTSALIAHILKKAGFNVRLGGNLGTPPLELIKNEDQENKTKQARHSLEPSGLTDSQQSAAWRRNPHVKSSKIDRLNRELAEQTSSRRVIKLQPIYVLELSSHQLSDLNQSPGIAVWLNLYPEHLDYYRDITEYAQAKSHIFRHQRPQDFFIYNADNPIISQLAKNAPAHTTTLTEKEAARIDLKHTQLMGKHNQFNLLAAIKVAGLFDISQETALESVADFTPLPHRLERVATINGVTYINDSLATNPDATIKAIETFQDQPIILIVGGYDRGLDYSDLAKKITHQSNIKAVIYLPETGKRLAKLIENNRELDARMRGHNVRSSEVGQLPSPLVSNLTEAVRQAKKLAQPGDVVLMSPASASFNQFKNYRERGEQFKMLVQGRTPGH